MAKKFLVFTVLFFGLIIVGLIVAINMFDLNAYKPKIQQLVKENTGYDLSMGDISVSFSPLGVQAKNISVAVPNQEAFAKLDNFAVALQLMPLLKQQIEVDYVLLSSLHVAIKNAANGANNYTVKQEKAQAKEGATQAKTQNKTPLVNVSKIRIENAQIRYEDAKSKTKASLEGINLAMNDISYDGAKEPLMAIGFNGDLKIAKLSYDKYNAKNFTVKFSMKDALVDASTITYSIFDSLASGKAQVDLSTKAPKLTFSQNIQKLALVNFSKEILQKDLLDGVLNMQVSIQTTLDTPEVLKKSLKGSVLFDGQGVGIIGYDLDKILGLYDKSQNVDMVDMGSFLVAGPLGFALSKSSDAAGTYSSLQGGKTLLKHLHVKLDFLNANVKLSDIALATSKNRVAIKGDLDLLKERFLDVKVGVLDAKNCAKYSQTIGGTFTKPNVKVDEGAINTVINLATSLFGKTKNMLGNDTNKACEVFYSGVVKQP
ncbi:MAG: AsmA family protein [Sulfurospirillum sp.]|nr:AsmA family protein [Sulfurospirillum sp.]